MSVSMKKRSVKFSSLKPIANGAGAGSIRRESTPSDPSDPNSPLIEIDSTDPAYKDWIDGDKDEKDFAVAPDGTPVPTEYEKKKQNFVVRTIWTLVMIAGFFFVLFMGHLYIVAVVTAVQIITFKEVIALSSVPAKEKNMHFTKALNWYFLVTTIYYLYGESIIYYFKHIVVVDAFLLPMASHHRFISFMLYMIGFVFFVGSLRRGHYRFQFTQFAWTHMALYLVVVQAHFTINNIFEGLIWFFLPASMVITNDIWAYICGISFGRTQLIKLSPKKTVEGFVGAWVCTMIYGLIATRILAQHSYFTCPVRNLGANIWTGLECTPNPVFLQHTYTLPLPLQPLLGDTFTGAPIYFHVLLMATFASLIAPFGGFFASGLKRTFKIKDFGDTIPGHGGITDRMDCQFIMGFFSNLYYQSFIATNQAVTVGGVLQSVIGNLTPKEQVEVVLGLQKYLAGQGIVSAEVYLAFHSPNIH
ncbi:hypothetical protein TWF694_011562 [Orbilia ellipsospora]|uniref:Phosphatidate cytidylyltransferase n=1 Tax=Orbilia ellipsospora TaxID=2528407 RepID=A0AAV9X879_9PEZI